MEQRRTLFTPLRVFGFILTIYFFLGVTPLGVRPLYFPDETRYSQIPREMLRSGNWLNPTFLGMPYYEKPASAYVPAVLSMKFFGETPFAARLPQAVAVMLCAAAVYLLARKMGEKESWTEEILKKWYPCCSACVLPTCGLFLFTGVYAVLDPMFAFCVTAAITAFYYAFHAESFGKRQLFLLLCGVFCAGAFFVKGFLGLVLPGMTAFLFLVWKKEWKKLFIMEWSVLLAFAVLVIPWAVLVHRAAPDFWRYFIFTEHLDRFLHAGKSGELHAAPVWYYLWVLPLILLPWSLYFALGWKGFRKIGMGDGTKFLLVWIGGMFLFFSLSRGKLPTYLLPLFPACVLLGTKALLLTWEESRNRLKIPSFVLCGVFYFFGTVPLLLSILTYFNQREMAPKSFYWISLNILFFAFLVGTLFKRAAKAGAVSGILLLTLSFMMCLAGFSNAPKEYIEKVTLQPWQGPIHDALKANTSASLRGIPEKERKKPELFAETKYAGALAWMLDRPDIRLYGKPGEFRYGLQSASGRLLDSTAFRKKIDSLKRGEEVILFLTHRHADRDFPAGKYNTTEPGKDGVYLRSVLFPGFRILIFTGK